MDNYSRKSLAIQAGKSLKGGDAVNVIESVTFKQQTLPKRMNVDNGSEFISKALDKCAYENNIELDFSRLRKSTHNLFIESFSGSFSVKCTI